MGQIARRLPRAALRDPALQRAMWVASTACPPRRGVGSTCCGNACRIRLRLPMRRRATIPLDLDARKPKLWSTLAQRTNRPELQSAGHTCYTIADTGKSVGYGRLSHSALLLPVGFAFAFTGAPVAQNHACPEGSYSEVGLAILSARSRRSRSALPVASQVRPLSHS